MVLCMLKMKERLRVLIIDDDEIILLLQNKFLQRCGFSSEIFTFKGGQKALEYLKNDKDKVATLILLDINMPKMTGWQFLDSLGNLNVPQETYVIMVSSSTENLEIEIRENYDRVIGFIEKPVSLKNCEEIKRMPQLKKYI